jgi:hypothetical protein
VRVVEGAAHLGHDAHYLGGAEWAGTGQALLQGLTFDIRHDVVEEAVGFA